MIDLHTKTNVSLSSLPINIDSIKSRNLDKAAEKVKNEGFFSMFKVDKSKTSKKINKIEIGGPINCVHVSHLGIESSFDVIFLLCFLISLSITNNVSFRIVAPLTRTT